MYSKSGITDNHGIASELSMGWVDPRIGLGWVGSGMGRKFLFLVVGLGHGSEMADVRKIHNMSCIL